MWCTRIKKFEASNVNFFYFIYFNILFIKSWNFFIIDNHY